MKPFEINLHFSEWGVKRIILKLIYKEIEIRTSIMEIIYKTKRTNCLTMLEKEAVEANDKKRIKFSLQVLNS